MTPPCFSQPWSNERQILYREGTHCLSNFRPVIALTRLHLTCRKNDARCRNASGVFASKLVRGKSEGVERATLRDLVELRSLRHSGGTDGAELIVHVEASGH